MSLIDELKPVLRFLCSGFHIVGGRACPGSALRRLVISGKSFSFSRRQPPGLPRAGYTTGRLLSFQHSEAPEAVRPCVFVAGVVAGDTFSLFTSAWAHSPPDGTESAVAHAAGGPGAGSAAGGRALGVLGSPFLPDTALGGLCGNGLHV